MDYKTLMDKLKENFSFSDIYENAIENKEKNFGFDEKLTTALKEKRAFGLNKYKEHSFQSNLENCMTSPTIEHAKEEMIDLFNYLLHEQYKNDILGLRNDKLKEITIRALDIYNDLSRL